MTCALGSSYALDVTLAWDANTELDLAGYAIHYDTESGGPYDARGAREGDSPIDILLDEDEDPDPYLVQFTLHDLPEGTYFFAVTASNTTGAESGYSNEASTADRDTASNTEADSSDYSNEASTADRQVSTSNSGVTAGGGGGGCFVATAGSVPVGRTKEISFSLLLVLLSLGAAHTMKKLRRPKTIIVPLAG